MADLPVPVGPTNSRGRSCIRNRSRKYFCFSVSTVWIISSFIYNIVWIISSLFLNIVWIISSVTYILRIISLFIYNIVWIVKVHLQHCVHYQLINLWHCVDYQFVIYNIVWIVNVIYNIVWVIKFNIIRIISSLNDNNIFNYSSVRKISRSLQQCRTCTF